MRLATAVALLALTAPPALAATVTRTDTPFTAGSAITLDPADFRGLGRPGSGQSVINDGRSVAVKDATSPRPYGRSAATPGGSWIDSQDLSHIRWAVDFDGQRVTSMSFRVSDAADQRDTFFEIASGGGAWGTVERRANATVDWITVAFDRAVDRATVVFRTRHNDGFGVSDARVCPVRR